MRKFNLLLAGTTAAAVLSGAAPALAQQTQPDATATSNDVVIVTGRAGVTERSKVDVSYATTGISDEVLRLQAAL